MKTLRLSAEEMINACRYEYIHNGKVGISTAFEIKEKKEIRLYIPRSVGATTVVLEIYNESVNNRVLEISGEWDGCSGSEDIYSFSISSKVLGTGLYYMRPRLLVFGEWLYGHRYDKKIYFDKNSDTHSMLQLSICYFLYSEPQAIKGGVIYHIFVDRFKRGGEVTVPDYAKIVDGEWSMIPEYPAYPGADLKNNTFYGGTLWGIIDELDYISSLGVSAIYLSPIFTSVSNHKYDTADYMTVDPMFGGEEALKALIAECNKRDIKIILDGVFNHTGADSIYFNKFDRFDSLGAYQSKKSEYYDWFDFQNYPDKYTCWWDIDILPRINPDKKACGDYFVGNSGVIKKYSDMGIYGFRLDVADELSDDFISQIKARLSEHKDDSILYGEVWEDASNKIAYDKRKKYYLGSELDGVMNYPIRVGIIDFLLGRGYFKLYYALTDVTNNAPERILHTQMNLLGTHDTERIITLLGGVSSYGKSNSELSILRMNKEQKSLAISRLICAYTVLGSLPGIPAIFYGDEAGLEGYSDPFNRMPYPWGEENLELLTHYKKIGAIRRKNKVYIDGEFKLIALNNDMLVFSRCDGKNSYITVVNNSSKTIILNFNASASSLLDSKRGAIHRLLPCTSNIYKVKTGTELEII